MTIVGTVGPTQEIESAPVRQVSAPTQQPHPRGSAAREPALDVMMLLLAVAAAQVGARLGDATPTPIGWAAGFVAGVILALAVGGAYRPRFALRFLDDARSILGATAIVAMSITFLRLPGGDDPSIASQGARMWLFGVCYLLGGRAAYAHVRARARRTGAGGAPTLIVGAGVVGQMVAKRLASRPEFGLRPVAFLDERPLESSRAAGLPILSSGSGVDGEDAGLAAKVTAAVREHGIAHVILAFSLASHHEELVLLRNCRELGASVSLVPRLFEAVPDQTRLERLGGVPLISVYPRDPRAWQFIVKYALDRLWAALLIIVLSPLMVVAALGVLVSLGRPIMFGQERVGIDGVPFRMLKFRTMHGRPEDRGEADAEWAAAVAGVPMRGSTSVAVEQAAPFGSLLRRLGLDELPQLINVLRGEMSLVGPRPERRAYVAMFEDRIHRYDERHRVKAGITGWAQVHGLRGDTSLSDRIEWDNYYIENWSPWLDLKILLLTSLTFFRRG
ncbi:MAG: sugar transferase [Actinomycetota bacterium]|nr:sugar transferase [Actinomycetota bacterium]